MTSERPGRVRIEDWANPQFSPEMAQMRAAVAPLAAQIRLERNVLLADAAAQTGLDDFGDRDFEERLDVLCFGLREEAGLAPFGMVSAYGFLLQLLKNRLLVQDLLKRHPEIHDVRIERPICIVGLPRTGTTHLHNLMSADPGLRSLPYWESLEPVLPEAERPAPGAPDPRVTRTAAALDVLHAMMPLFNRFHEMTVDHSHEEIQLLAIDFSTMLFESMYIMPTWQAYYRAHDQTPHYQYMKTVLKVLQWLRGGTRWVLKSPQHLEQFGPLVSVFPDATFVVTHRDPLAVTVSMAIFNAYANRMNVDRPDPLTYGRYWSARIQAMLAACVRDRNLLPAERSIDVRFHEFMADDFAMVQRIYTLAGQPMTPAVRAAMDAFLATHPRGKYGAVVYDPATVGIDVAECRAALRFYVERFGLEEELR
ncbi:MAG: putative sulfotransferase [Deltaproteobacteria bacterium]|nr:putative sulfotransferase [Deltaproteobacteria bacterium]